MSSSTRSTPTPAEEAFDRVDAWIGAGSAVIVEPTVDHARIVRRLLRDLGTGGNLVNDAHLAALSLEHQCVLVSYDNAFDRFEGIRREQPGREPG